jgi:hypothetical protein
VEDLTGTLELLAVFLLQSLWATHALGNTLGNDGNALDLRELEELHRGRVYGTRRGEVDDGVDIGVLANGLVYGLVDGQQSLAGSPVPAVAD